MSHAALARMDADRFLQWRLGQVGRWELVGGEPILLMAGATRRHDKVVVNLIVALAGRLRGGPCFPQTADIGARMHNGNVRQPDVTVDCAPGHADDLVSSRPTVFFEVLSPTTRSFDFIVKAEEYKRVPSLKHFVLIDPRRTRIWCWTRPEDGDWTDALIDDPGGELALPGIDISLTLQEIYADVEVETAGTT